MNINNKFLKYKQKYLNFKEQIGGNTTCLYVCDKQEDSDTKFILSQFQITEDNIIYIDIEGLDTYLSGSDKFNCVIINNCTRINAKIVSSIHTLLLPLGILYIKSNNLEDIQFYKENIKFKYIEFDTPFSIMKKEGNITKEEAHQIAELLKQYIDNDIKYNNLHQSELLKEIIRNPDYFEKQQIDTLGCGRHALNNLFGQTLFVSTSKKMIPYELEEMKHIAINIETRKMDLNRICEYFKFKIGTYVLDECLITEYYNVSLLGIALSLCGYINKQISNDIFNRLDKYNTLTDYVGFIINYPDHWVSLRKIDNGYMFYNSMDGRPILFKTINEYISSKRPTILNILIVFKRCTQVFDDSIINGDYEAALRESLKSNEPPHPDLLFPTEEEAIKATTRASLELQLEQSLINLSINTDKITEILQNMESVEYIRYVLIFINGLKDKKSFVRDNINRSTNIKAYIENVILKLYNPLLIIENELEIDKSAVIILKELYTKVVTELNKQEMKNFSLRLKEILRLKLSDNEDDQYQYHLLNTELTSFTESNIESFKEYVLRD